MPVTIRSMSALISVNDEDVSTSVSWTSVALLYSIDIRPPRIIVMNLKVLCWYCPVDT
jgi:hypothetical protein